MHQQIVNFALNPEFSLDNFITTTNGELLKNLHLATAQKTAVLYIYGETSTGKTHLLQALTNLALAKNIRALYFDLAENNLQDFMENILASDIVALDNLDKADLNTQKLVFDLYNHQNDFNLIITGNSLNNLEIQADLKTRIFQALNFKLDRLSDDLCLKALQEKAKNKGLKIEDKILLYLQKNYSRDLQKLSQALEKLDLISMQQRKKISINLIKNFII